MQSEKRKRARRLRAKHRQGRANRARIARMSTLNLRKLRIQSGRTLEQIAVSAGVSISAISRVERGGGTRPSNMEGIARAYRVTTEQLADAIFANHASLAIPTGGAPHPGGQSAANGEEVAQTGGGA